MKRTIVEHIAYKGEKFTIERYFDEREYSQSQEYYFSLNRDERIQLLKLLKRMGDAGVIYDKTKALKVMEQYMSKVKMGEYYE